VEFAEMPREIYKKVFVKKWSIMGLNDKPHFLFTL
jgi:hypothetical protein